MILSCLRGVWCVARGAWLTSHVSRLTSHASGFTPSLTRHASLVTYHLLLTVLLLPVVAFFSSPVVATTVTTQEVEEALTCQCGCGLTVHSCNHLQCGFAIPAKKTISELVAQGKGKEEITTYFVAGDGEFSGYGEKVLSAPTTSGFNLAAWITPFLAIIVGGVLLGVISVRWARRQPPTSGSEPQGTVVTDQQRERLKKELDSFDS